MRVFRLSRKKYAHSLSGKGAAIAGSRWNSKGVEMIYTAESRALAMAEVAVHLSLNNLPQDFMMMEVDIPEVVPVENLNNSYLPEGWNKFPFNSKTQIMGDNFVRKQKAAVMKVSSAVVAGDYNYLINPTHREFLEISIVEVEKFIWDQRLFT